MDYSGNHFPAVYCHLMDVPTISTSLSKNNGEFLFFNRKVENVLAGYTSGGTERKTKSTIGPAA